MKLRVQDMFELVYLVAGKHTQVFSLKERPNAIIANSNHRYFCKSLSMVKKKRLLIGILAYLIIKTTKVRVYGRWE